MRRSGQQQQRSRCRQTQRNACPRPVEGEHRPRRPAEDIARFIGRAAEQDRTADQQQRGNMRKTCRVSAPQHGRQIVARGDRQPPGKFLEREGGDAREEDRPQQRRAGVRPRAGSRRHRARPDKRRRNCGPQEDRADTLHCRPLWRKLARTAIRRGGDPSRTAPARRNWDSRGLKGGTRSGRASSSAGDARRTARPTSPRAWRA